MIRLLRPTLPLAIAAALAAAALPAAHAATPASAPAAGAAPVAIDAEKQKLITQVLALWHPENALVAMVQRPGVEMLEKSRAALVQNHVAADKADKTMQDISADVHKYVDAASPLVVASARKYADTTVAPLLAQNFTAEELRQLIALLQSPLRAKFDKVVPQSEQALGRKVQEDVGPEVNKQIQALGESVGTKLRAAIPAK